MTRRERLERKVERRREWAEKAKQKSEAAFDAVHRIADAIPLGQPILIGHHSERHARRDAERIHNGMARAVELDDKAKRHVEKAAGLEGQLETCIFADDHDAIEQLRERIAERKIAADHMVAVNKAWKKLLAGNAADLLAMGWDVEMIEHAKMRIARLHHWENKPHPGFEMTNLRACIRRDEQRIKEIEARNAKAAEAEAAGGVVVKYLAGPGNDGYCTVTFAAKPEREILNALREAGFWWGRGSWTGRAEKLPEIVKNLVNEGGAA